MPLFQTSRCNIYRTFGAGLHIPFCRHIEESIEESTTTPGGTPLSLLLPPPRWPNELVSAYEVRRIFESVLTVTVNQRSIYALILAHEPLYRVHQYNLLSLRHSAILGLRVQICMTDTEKMVHRRLAFVNCF